MPLPLQAEFAPQEEPESAQPIQSGSRQNKLTVLDSLLPDSDSGLSERVRLSVEGILGNEALTAELDDQAANILLEWVIACAKDIARGTAGLDDAQAEQVMYPRLRALNKMARLVANWVVAGTPADLGEQASLLAQISTQAGIVYSGTPPVPDALQIQTFVQQASDPLQAIANLRTFIEGGLSY